MSFMQVIVGFIKLQGLDNNGFVCFGENYRVMKATILLLPFFVSISLFAQTNPVKGKVSISVSNRDNIPLEGATVELLKAKDSALTKSAVTDKAGLAEIENVPFGTYIIKVTMISHSAAYSAAFSISEEQPVTSLPSLMLLPKAVNTQEATVTTRKPFIQKLSDRIVVNVENSIISAGSTAMDVLERSPGVTVNQNDEIAFRGRQGVVIMIDGKPSPLAGAALAAYLRSLPSNAIERIDLITNPSAKYDAAGNSGIIDIRLKKDQRQGSNGTVTAGYGQGVYPKANAGISYNYRKKKINLFGNYNYGYRKGLNHLILDRNFYTNNKVFTGADDKDNYMVFPITSHSTRVGLDFFPSRKTIVGVILNANFTGVKRTNESKARVYDAQRIQTFKFNTQADSKDNYDNIVGNINLKHTFDSTGRELTADFDYGVFDSKTLSNTLTQYYEVDGRTLRPNYRLDGDQDGKLSITSGKADYVHPFNKTSKLEAGFKTSFVHSDNDVKFFDVSSGTPLNDAEKTNHFFYDENINAGYVNLYKEYKKFNVTLGLRAEQTNIKTRQVVQDQRFDSSYLQLFPSAFFNYKLAEDKTIGLSVSRRINRPNYSQLNPFQSLIDVTLYTTGNTRLLPMRTWSYEVSYTHKQLNFTLGYSHTTNDITTAILRYNDVFPTAPRGDNVTVQIPLNLLSSDYIGLSIAAPVRLSKWWNMVNNGDLYYISYKGNLANTQLTNGALSARISNNNNFTFKKGWTAELNFNYYSSGTSGYMVTKDQWALGAGVQKTILKSQGTVRFSISDIFWTNLPRATITYNNYIENWHAFRESRVANLSFTYRFGNNKVAPTRRRTTASEEERRRAG
jgi:iron complex outermembrane receptor protein